MLHKQTQRPPSSFQITASNNAHNRHSQLLRQFNEDIFKRNVLTDVECVVEGEVFKAHRDVLICFSSFLKRKLLSTDEKSITDKIEIPKVGSNEFEILLNYMYSGTMDINCNNVFDVYKAASVLEMQDAKRECLQVITRQNEISTYFFAYVLSKRLGVRQNWEKALKLITHRFEETALSKEFMLLNLEYTLQILSAQDIGARSEIIVFLASLNWLNHDLDRRGAFAPKVLACVRFSSMSMNEIIACYHPPFLSEVMQIPEIIMMLFKATCYIAAKSQGQETWFKKYASPKRNLSLESLPMELWHQESTHSNKWWNGLDEEGENDGMRDKISGLCKRSRHPVPVTAEKTGQENKHLHPTKPFIARKCLESIPAVKEETGDVRRLPTSQIDLLLRRLSATYDSDEDPGADNESSANSETNEHKTLSSKLKVTGKPSVLKIKENKLKNSIQSTLQTSCSSNEVQFSIPQPARILHLRKESLKPSDSTLDPRQKDGSPTHEQSNVSRKEDASLQKLTHGVSREKLFESMRKTVESDEPCCSKMNNMEKERAVLQSTEDPFAEKEKQNNNSLTANKLKESSSVPLIVDVSKRSGAKMQGDEKILPPVKATIRNQSCILVIGGMNPKNCKKEIGAAVSIFDPNTSKWLPFSSLPEPRQNHCSAILDTYLYVVGGCHTQKTIASGRYVASRSCYRLDLTSMKWSTLPEMKCCRYDHGMVVYGGQLYIIGGQDENNKLLKSVEVYQPPRSRWKLLNSSMCCGRKAMGVAVYSDRIWVVGGLIQSEKEGKLEAVSHVDYYNPAERRWHFNIYPLPGPRFFCSLASWNEKLYCVGGMVPTTDDGDLRATDEVWFIESEDDLWKKGPALPQPKIGGVAVTCDDNLTFLGGFDPDCKTDVFNISLLIPGSSSWNIGPPLLSHIFGFSAVSYKSK